MTDIFCQTKIKYVTATQNYVMLSQWREELLKENENSSKAPGILNLKFAQMFNCGVLMKIATKTIELNSFKQFTRTLAISNSKTKNKRNYSNTEINSNLFYYTYQNIVFYSCFLFIS